MNRVPEKLAASILFAVAVWLFVRAFSVSGPNEAPQIEFLGNVLVAVLSGLGGLYAISSAREKEGRDAARARDREDREANLTVSTTVLSAYAQHYFRQEVEPKLKQLELNVVAAGKYLDVEYHEELRKRERRDAALLKLSSALMKSTRAFEVLTEFKPVRDESIEPLVNALAQSLAAREAFRTAREELVSLRVMRQNHEDLLRDYGRVMTRIVMDLRSDPSHDEAGYRALMVKHAERLKALDDGIKRRLSVFLAPKHTEALTPDLA